MSLDRYRQLIDRLRLLRSMAGWEPEQDRKILGVLANMHEKFTTAELDVVELEFAARPFHTWPDPPRAYKGEQIVDPLAYLKEAQRARHRSRRNARHAERLYVAGDPVRYDALRDTRQVAKKAKDSARQAHEGWLRARETILGSSR